MPAGSTSVPVSKRLAKRIPQRTVIVAVCAAAMMAGCLGMVPCLGVGGYLVFWTARGNNQRTLDELVAEFPKRGLKTNVLQKFPNAGAGEWWIVGVGEMSLQFAKFDLADPRQAEAMKDLIARGPMKLWAGHPPAPILVNGSFLMVGHTLHPNQRRLEDVFLGF